jgi:hypothetical protein
MMQRKKGLRMKDLQPSFTSTSRLRVADYVLGTEPTSKDGSLIRTQS